MATSDAAFENFGETLEELRFYATQFLKRTILAADDAILSTRLRPSLIVALAVLITVGFFASLSLLKTLFTISNPPIRSLHPPTDNFIRIEGNGLLMGPSFALHPETDSKREKETQSASGAAEKAIHAR